MTRRESGGIGRRTRLRIWRGNPWGFESPLSHQELPSSSLPRSLLECPPKVRHSLWAHFAGKETASGKETSGAVSQGISPNGSGALEELRQHRAAGARTGF